MAGEDGGGGASVTSESWESQASWAGESVGDDRSVALQAWQVVGRDASYRVRDSACWRSYSLRNAAGAQIDARRSSSGGPGCPQAAQMIWWNS